METTTKSGSRTKRLLIVAVAVVIVLIILLGYEIYQNQNLASKNSQLQSTISQDNNLLNLSVAMQIWKNQTFDYPSGFVNASIIGFFAKYAGYTNISATIVTKGSYTALIEVNKSFYKFPFGPTLQIPVLPGMVSGRLLLNSTYAANVTLSETYYS